MSDPKVSDARAVVSVLQSEQFQGSLSQALPAGLSRDRFTRCVITALQANPGIVEGDRQSLYASIVRAAQDGLNLDGREAALVHFNTNVGTKDRPKWIRKVQYMPMIGGLIRKLGEAGYAVDAQVVHENDVFEATLGDSPSIVHKPPALGQKRGEMIGAYAIIRRKSDGETYREIMDAEQIEAVRGQSRAKDSLMWTTFASEAWRKTVLRRCIKRIPMPDTSNVDSVIEADNDTYEFDQTPAVDPVVSEQPNAQPTRPAALKKIIEKEAEENVPVEPDEVYSEDSEDREVF